MDSREATRNLKDAGTWRRLVYIILFALIFNAVQAVLTVVVVVQFLSRAFTGATLKRLDPFAQGLSSYVYEIVLSLTFRSDDTPFPFAPWREGPPEPGEEPLPAAGAEAADVRERRRRRRARRERREGQADA